MAAALGVAFEREDVCSQSLQHFTPAAGCTVTLEETKQQEARSILLGGEGGQVPENEGL